MLHTGGTGAMETEALLYFDVELAVAPGLGENE